MNIEAVNHLCKNTFVDALGIAFLDYRPGFLSARMPVDEKKLQPAGFLHGGASLALAETVASCGSLLMVDRDLFAVFGLQIVGHHLASTREGDVVAHGELIHEGKSTHLWDVTVISQDGTKLCIARVTNSIVRKARTVPHSPAL
ncbi:MAG: PaaI family thioesterase [Verrucomicrobiia bacterium]